MDFSKPLSTADFLEGIEDYIAFPNVGFEVNRMVEDEKYSAIDIANEIAKDPLVAAQVLRLANSVYYQFPSSVDSIPRAIAVIGTDDLRNLVLMLSLVNASRNDVPTSTVNIEYIWQHGLFVGLLAGEFSKHLSTPFHNSDRLFIAGVLHEIGRIIFSIKAPEQYSQLVNGVQDLRLPFYQLEKKYLGFAHNDVSSLLLQKWNFPRSLIEIVKFQYQPAESSEFILESALLLLANKYSEETGLGSIGIDDEARQVELAIDICQIPEESLRKAIEESRQKYFALLPAFILQKSA